MSTTAKFKKIIKRLTDNNFDEDTLDKLIVPVITSLMAGIESMMSDDEESNQEDEQEQEDSQEQGVEVQDDDDDLLSEDEQNEEEQEEAQPQPVQKKRGRPAKVAVEDDDDDDDIFAELEEDEDEQEEQEQEAQQTPKKRGRKPKAVVEAAPEPKKRGRKPKAVVQEEEQEQPVQKKRGRKPKAVVADTGPNYDAMKNSELVGILQDFGGDVAKATAKATDIKSKKVALIKAIGVAQSAHAALVEKGLAKLEAVARSKKLEIKLDGRMKESKKAAAIAKILLQNGIKV